MSPKGFQLSGVYRHNSRDWKRLLLNGILIALSIILPLCAQETTAGIQGIVKDPSGAAVANATVEVSGPALIGIRRVKTNDSGSYHVAALAPGEYA